MSTIDELCELMHDTYETAAVKHGWKTNSDSRVPWAYVPSENKAAMRDAVTVVVESIREEEREKNDTGAIHGDLVRIMKALDISTHARPFSSSEVVRKEIVPKILKLKKSLFDVRALIDRQFVEAKYLLDEGRNLE